jgi:SAM-dependent methyltransferase
MSSYEARIEMANSHIEAGLSAGVPAVLEAGGGLSTHVRLRRPHTTVVVDISPEQLSRNIYADEKILGDIQDPSVFTRKFDLIVCWDVLEHLPHPSRAIDNMIDSLAEAGLLVLAAPNPFSAKGLVTRFTPHWIHVWYYRRVLGDKLAGQNGRLPFRTYLKAAMSPNAILTKARSNHLNVLFSLSYVGPEVESLQKKLPGLFWLYQLPVALVRMLTFGKVELGNTDFIVILQKKPLPALAA